MAKACRQVGKATQGLQEGLHTRVAETQRGTALTVSDSGPLESLEARVGRQTFMAERLGIDHTLGDGVTDRAQVGQVGRPFVGTHVSGIVDGGLTKKLAIPS